MCVCARAGGRLPHLAALDLGGSCTPHRDMTAFSDAGLEELVAAKGLRELNLSHGTRITDTGQYACVLCGLGV